MELFAWLDLHRLWIASGVLLGAGLLRAAARAPGSSAENESGLVIKRFGRPLPPGRLVALDGEAGYQAGCCRRAGTSACGGGSTRSRGVRWSSSGPGRSALVVAADGSPIPSERILGREVDCDDFQDARAFLAERRREGPAAGILTAGTYRINPALFTIITPDNAAQHGAAPRRSSQVFQVPADRGRHRHGARRQPIPPGDLAGPDGVRATTASSAARRSSTPAAAAACRSRCCCRARGT